MNFDKILMVLGVLAIAGIFFFMSSPNEVKASCSFENCTLCGDANGDGFVNVGDVVTIKNYVFYNGTLACEDESDVNGDCEINGGDVVYLKNYVFSGGPAPHCDCNATNFSNY